MGSLPPSNPALQTWPDSGRDSSPVISQHQPWGLQTDSERYLRALERRLAKVKEEQTLPQLDSTKTHPNMINYDDEDAISIDNEEEEAQAIPSSSSYTLVTTDQDCPSEYIDEDGTSDNDEMYHEGRRLLSPCSSIEEYNNENNDNNDKSKKSLTLENIRNADKLLTPLPECSRDTAAIKSLSSQQEEDVEDDDEAEAEGGEMIIDKSKPLSKPQIGRIRFYEQVRIAGGIRSGSHHTHRQWVLNKKSIGGSNSNARKSRLITRRSPSPSVIPSHRTSYEQLPTTSSPSLNTPLPITAIPRRLSTTSTTTIGGLAPGGPSSSVASSIGAASRSSSPCSSIYAPLRAPSKFAPNPSRNIPTTGYSYLSMTGFGILGSNRRSDDDQDDPNFSNYYNSSSNYNGFSKNYLDLVTKQRHMRRMYRFRKRRRKFFQTSLGVSSYVWNTMKKPFVTSSSSSATSSQKQKQPNSIANSPHPPLSNSSSTPLLPPPTPSSFSNNNNNNNINRKKTKLKTESDVIWGPRPRRWFRRTWWRHQLIESGKSFKNLFTYCFGSLSSQENDDF